MTQNPPQWGPQGGYPPQQPPGGYPPQQPPGGYPPQQPPPGYNPQGGYNPQQGGYAGQGGYPPQGQPPQGPPPQGQPPGGGYPPQGPTPPHGGGYSPQGAPSGKKSPALIIGIVVAAVVLLAAIGGIFMVLRGGGDQPPPVSITPSQPVPPTDQPTPSPTEEPTPGPSTEGPTDEPSPGGSTPPSGDAVDLGNGIALSPAADWEVKKTGKGLAQLSDGKSVFLGQVISADPSTNAGQLCTAWHQKVAEGSTNGKFGEPKTADLGSTKLKAATCNAQVTVSNGQGTATIVLFTLVSVRQSDGVTVLGTAYFTPNADTQKLDKDFSAMVNSMLQGQVKG